MIEYCEKCQGHTWHDQEDLGIGWHDYAGNQKIDSQIEWICEECGEVNFEI